MIRKLLITSSLITFTNLLYSVPPTLAQQPIDFATQGCQNVPQEAYFRTQTYHINICRGQTGLFMVINFMNGNRVDRLPVQQRGDNFEGTSRGTFYSVNRNNFTIQPPNQRPITERVVQTTGGNNRPQQQQGTITGTVSYLQRIALPDNATIVVTLRESGRGNTSRTPIAQETIQTRGQQVPIPFRLNYDPARIQPDRVYIVFADIFINRQLAWVTRQEYRVITQGNPSNVEIIVQPAN